MTTSLTKTGSSVWILGGDSTAVPEPDTGVLLLGILGGSVMLLRRKRGA